MRTHVQQSHDDHRNKAIAAMSKETTAEGRHRAQLTVQHEEFTRGIAAARADTAVTKEQLLDMMEHANTLFGQSISDIVKAVAHGVGG